MHSFSLYTRSVKVDDGFDVSSQVILRIRQISVLKGFAGTKESKSMVLFSSVIKKHALTFIGLMNET